MKAIAPAAAILLMIFFQCCPSTTTDETPGPEPTDTPVIWTLIAPGGLTHALFTKDCLIDESCPDCVIGDLSGGTRMEPGGEGCHRAEWDTGDPAIHPGGPYVYCHVVILDGELAGNYGWVNENFIQK